MKIKFTIFYLLLLGMFYNNAFALKVKITDDGSSIHHMDDNWLTVASGLGHTALIVPVSILNDTNFFDTTDILIVSAGIPSYTATQKANMEKFVESGKSIYIQGEYLITYDGNVIASNIINNLGGTFSWTGTVSGSLNPDVSGSLSYKNDTVTSLTYYWYGATGTTSCDVMPFLKTSSGSPLGWMFRPPTAAYGRLIFTSDQDWVTSATTYPDHIKLMKNIIRHLADASFGDVPSLTPPTISISANPSTPVCEGVSISFPTVKTGGSSSTTYQWYKNSLPVSTDSVYSSTTLINKDTVWVVMTNTICNLKDTSNKVVLNIAPSRIYVDSAIAVSGTGKTWASPIKTVSEALTLANQVSCAVEIWVKKGTYYPMAGTSVTTSRDSAFRIYRNNIKLYGGFAGTETSLSPRSIFINKTTLSGDINIANDTADNSYHVVTMIGTGTASGNLDTNTVLDGFIISKGNCNGGGSFNSQGVQLRNFDGGGLYIVTDGSTKVASPLVENCSIEKNRGTYGAGMYCAGYSGGQVAGVNRYLTIIDNISNSVGGGLINYCDGVGSIASPLYERCSLQNNLAVSEGGGAFSNGNNGNSSPVYKECLFSTNRVSGAGGGDYGGAYCGFGSLSVPVFNNCRFSNNKSGSYGGGIMCFGTASVTIQGCEFTGNTSASGGGANIIVATTANISGSTYTGNSGNTGGGIELYNTSTCNIDSCTFVSNTVTLYGSALRANNSSTFNVKSSKFLTNTGGIVGAVDNGSGFCNFTNCVFSGNTTGELGGVINNNSGNATFTQCLLTGNSTTTAANNGGGAVHVTTGTVTFNNSTLSNNTTASTAAPNGNSVAVDGAGTAIFNNTIVWGGAAQHITGPGTKTYNYSLVKGAGLTAPNSSSDPQFINAADANGTDNIWGTSDDGLKTFPCSPTRNAGLNSLVPGTLTTDFASDARIQFTTVDMGAYEHNDTAMSIPDIAITANPGNAICAGTLVSFPTTVVGSGAAPTYQWYKNGTVVSTASSYSSSSLVTNDTIWVVMTNTNCNLSDTSAKIVMTVAPPILYVDSSVTSSGAGTSWATAYKTVTEALNVANATPSTCFIEIWVKKGTYYPHPSARDSSFRIARNNIKMYGGFAGGESTLSARSVSTNPTILSGNLGTVTDSTDNCYHVLTIIARAPSLLIDTNTIVDGFTITGGNGYLMSGSYTYGGVTMNRQDGGGILINGVGSGNKCSPLINNCIITRNAANFGGGIYIAAMSTGSTSPILRNTAFITNRANSNGGGLFNNTQLTGVNVLTIENCKFTSNLAPNGAGLFNQGGSGGNISGTVKNTTFEFNSGTNGGGIYNAGNCTVTYTGNTFNSNGGNVGGGAFNSSSATLTYTNNTFTNNTATTSGGAMQSSAGTINLSLCVFSGNTASAGSAGAYQNESTASTTFTNCLLVNNTAAGVSADGGGAIKNTAGTVNLNSSTLYNNSTASTTKPNGNTITTLSGSTTNITNTIIWGSATTHLDAAGTVNYSYALVKGASLSAPSLSIDPRFVNPSNPIGADNIWLTADDGLELIPCSPAVNAATTSPATDIRNRTRLGLPDMGAYEEQTGIIPTPPVVSSPVTYCQNALASALTATKSSASDTLKWYNATPTLLAGAPTPLTTTAGTTTYYVSQTNATGCESAKSTINVVVNPAATAPTVTTPVTYCQGVTATALTATAASSSDTLKWYNAALTPLAAAPTPSTATVGSTDYWVSAKSSLGCEGNKTKITVVVNPTPALPTSASPVVYCQGFPAVPLTATAASASDTLRWFDATPTLLSGAPTPSTATVGSTTYYVSQKNAFGCEGAKRTITVTVNTTPAAPAAPSPVTYCQDEISVALTGTKAAPSDTLKWYNAALTLLASAPIPSTTVPGTYTFYVSDKTSLGCEGPKTTVTVQVNPKPAAPTVVTPIDLCVGVPASPLAATGINLKWYTVATGGTSSPTLTPAIGTVGATTYYVSQTSLLNCEGPRASLTVNVRPSPVVTVTTMTAPAFVFCVGDSVALKAVSPTATTYQWYRNTITMPGSTRDTLTVKSTATYGVIAKNIYGCADTESVSVIENPLPVPHLSPEDVNICDGVILMLYASPARSGYKYEWFKDGITMGIDTADSKTPVNLSGGYTIRVTDIYGCVLTTNVASVNTYPVLPTPTIVMIGGVLKLSLSYASYQWYRNGKPILGATGSSHIPMFDGIYTVKVNDINGCDATSGEFSVQGLGIREQNSGNKTVSLYPNPTQNKVIIEAGEKVNLKVTDITGKLVLQTENATEADLQNYADGIYMFYITDTEGKLLLTQKVWKKN